MKHIKTYEGFFGKDDDIGLMLISILEKGEYTNLEHYSSIYKCKIDGKMLSVDNDFLLLDFIVTYKNINLNLSLKVASKLYKTMKTIYKKKEWKGKQEKERKEKQDIRDSLYHREADKFGF